MLCVIKNFKVSSSKEMTFSLGLFDENLEYDWIMKKIHHVINYL